MFVRVKPAGNHRYLQIVENRWEAGRSRQRVIATLGRLDRLQAAGQVDGLLRSLARFAEQVKIVEAYETGKLQALSVARIGPTLVMEPLWRRLGLAAILNDLLADRHFDFAVERAIYFTVLSRLFFPGSDRRASRLGRDYRVRGGDDLELHQFYRAMGWLGAVKEQVEERLFARNRDLFSGLDLVFFDTTSIYFEGQGGEQLGQHGYSKDHRSDLRQVVVGVTMDTFGRPISCPIWPGNMTDVKTLKPVVTRLRERFGIKDLVIVADRGMICNETLQWLEQNGIGYILGVRLRKEKDISRAILDQADGYQVVKENLQVKEVVIAGHRYVLCVNPEEAIRDAAVRAALVEKLQAKLKQGSKAVIGNRGYRRYLNVSKTAVTLAEKKIQAEASFDGKYVLRTNTKLTTTEVALKYKELWQVERCFRETKSTLETRPVYHKCKDTITGHVFCSFLALVVMTELKQKLGEKVEWDVIRQDLDALYEVEVRQDEERYVLRSPLQGVCGKALKAAGAAIPPSVRALKT
jgi:hypothetical protein